RQPQTVARAAARGGRGRVARRLYPGAGWVRPFGCARRRAGGTDRAAPVVPPGIVRGPAAPPAGRRRGGVPPPRRRPAPAAWRRGRAGLRSPRTRAPGARRFAIGASPAAPGPRGPVVPARPDPWWPSGRVRPASGTRGQPPLPLPVRGVRVVGRCRRGAPGARHSPDAGRREEVPVRQPRGARAIGPLPLPPRSLGGPTARAARPPRGG